MEEEKPFWAHLEDLRKLLISVLVVFGVVFILSWLFVEPLYEAVVAPLKEMTSASSIPVERQALKWEKVKNTTTISQLFSPAEGVEPFSLAPGEEREISYLHPPHSLLILSPLEGFLVAFKIVFIASLTISLPLILLLVGGFVLPALYPHEKLAFKVFCALFVLANLAALATTFYGVLPWANRFFWQWNSPLGINSWTLSHYVDYSLALLFSTSVLFNLGVALLFVVHRGWLPQEMLKKGRRGVILAAFILGALFTPPDVPSQLAFAFVLIGFYEGAILYQTFLTWIRSRRS